MGTMAIVVIVYTVLASATFSEQATATNDLYGQAHCVMGVQSAADLADWHGPLVQERLETGMSSSTNLLRAGILVAMPAIVKVVISAFDGSCKPYKR